jgi:hypothetical protein
MALYEITRTDEVAPGEFVSAYVIAGGSALARSRVQHLSGVAAKGKNLHAERVDTAKVDLLLSVYFDERDPAPAVDDVDDVPAFPSDDEPFTEVDAAPVPVPAPNFL